MDNCNSLQQTDAQDSQVRSNLCAQNVLLIVEKGKQFFICASIVLLQLIESIEKNVCVILYHGCVHEEDYM